MSNTAGTARCTIQPRAPAPAPDSVQRDATSTRYACRSRRVRGVQHGCSVVGVRVLGAVTRCHGPAPVEEAGGDVPRTVRTHRTAPDFVQPSTTLTRANRSSLRAPASRWPEQALTAAGDSLADFYRAEDCVPRAAYRLVTAWRSLRPRSVFGVGVLSSGQQTTVDFVSVRNNRKLGHRGSARPGPDVVQGRIWWTIYRRKSARFVGKSGFFRRSPSTLRVIGHLIRMFEHIEAGVHHRTLKSHASRCWSFLVTDTILRRGEFFALSSDFIRNGIQHVKIFRTSLWWSFPGPVGARCSLANLVIY
ncbi:hypothetical protein C8R45DRAFT_1148016 [Mycena sanguinolenta]|nr:hypothetical protein C8R45DRAFT_1148016 [Mycena sanguinolenta]